MDTTRNPETPRCGKAKWSMVGKSPVCDKPAGHDGRHHFDVDGPWGVRNESGRYIVEVR